MKIVSNVQLNGYDYVGIFGYNTGTIEGFVFDHITVLTTGRNLGAVVGYNAGTIKGIKAVNLNVSSSEISIEDLNNELFGEFYWWKALLKNNEVLLYVSPKWQIYTDNNLYWEYWFDDATNSVIYTFRDSANWANMWSVKTKIKNLLEY